MKTYDLAQWSGFPFDQEVLKEIQNYYQSGMNAFFESMKPASVMLIGGCNIISGSLAAGGVVSDGIAYHPQHGLMLVKGGTFADDATITINVLASDLEFEGANNHPAEISKFIEIDNLGGDGAFVNLVQNTWYNVLGKLTGDGAFVEMPGRTAKGGLWYKYNPLTRMVSVSGHGEFGAIRSAGGALIYKELLGSNGFNTTSLFAIPAHLRPARNIVAFAAINSNVPSYNPNNFRRASGEFFLGTPVTLTTSGNIAALPFEMWSGVPLPIISFEFTYML